MSKIFELSTVTRKLETEVNPVHISKAKMLIDKSHLKREILEFSIKGK